MDMGNYFGRYNDVGADELVEVSRLRDCWVWWIRIVSFGLTLLRADVIIL